MMTIEQEVQEAKQRYLRLLKVNSLIKEKSLQLAKQEDKVYSLYKQVQKENNDIEELEQSNFSTLFLKVIGKMDERKEKEVQEAHIVELRYNEAKRVENEIRNELTALQKEQETLEFSRQEYLDALEKKRASLNPEQLAKIGEIQTKIDNAQYNIKEGLEAIEAGKYAKEIAEKIYNDFNSAASWGVADLLGVMDLVADVAKHAKINAAKRSLNELQSALRAFKTELVDIRINIDVSIDISDFDTIMDFMVDNVFSDYMVQSKIARAKEKFGAILNEIEEVLNELNTLVKENEKAIKEYKRVMLDYLES